MAETRRIPLRFLGRAIGFLIVLVLSFKVLARGLSPTESGFILAVLDGANLIFHEVGHVIFLFFGEFLHYLGGSLTQIAIPAALAGYFWIHEQRASSAVTLFWMGENLTNVAIYVADAQKMELPLIGGDHDWNYLLDQFGLVHRAESVGGFVFFLGMLSILFSLLLLAADMIRNWKPAAAE